MSSSAVELVGYLASALVVASLAMTSVVRLRTVSLIGSLVFVAYGALLPSIPIIITNAAVAGLNIWFLRKEFGAHRDLGAVPIEPRAPFLVDFLSSHTDDIASFHRSSAYPRRATSPSCSPGMACPPVRWSDARTLTPCNSSSTT